MKHSMRLSAAPTVPPHVPWGDGREYQLTTCSSFEEEAGTGQQDAGKCKITDLVDSGQETEAVMCL